MPDEWIKREVQVARQVSASTLPTPKFIAETTYSDRRAIIYERIEGISMLRLVGAKPWRIVDLSTRFARLHAQINQESGAGLSPLRADIERNIIAAKNLPAELKDFALGSLSELPDGDSLCHYDFHPDQVMVTGRGLIILDWMNAFRGDSHADVAHTSNLLTLARPPKTTWLMEKLIDAARGAFFNAYKKETIARRPDLDWALVERWRIPTAAGRLNARIAGEVEPILQFLWNKYKSR